MKHLGDITTIDWSKVEPVDVVTGGSPCQDLSVAGKRAGLAGERSGLFMEQIRCVKELRKADEQRGRTAEFIRPRYMVWENVCGALSSGKPKGADFGAVLEELVKVVEPQAPPVSVPEKGWPAAGCLYDDMGRWSIAWRVHDAQFWGVPQRRKRIALVADFGGLSAPEILFERKGLRGYFAEGRAQGQGVAVDAETGSCAANPAEHGRVSSRVLDDQQCVVTVLGYDMYNQQSTGEISRTLKTPIGGDDLPVVCAKTFDARGNGGEPIPINTMLATRDKALGRGTGLGVGKSGDAQFTISAAHSHAVCCFEPRSQDGTPRIHEGGCPQRLIPHKEGKDNHA